MRTPIISMYGPWSNWVALGWKTIETRTHDHFRSLEGKYIGIHRTLKWDEKALDLAGRFLTPEQRDVTLRFLKVGGAITHTAFVYKHRELNMFDSRAALIDCTSGKFGLFLRDVRMIEMIPCRGKQGIWYYDIPEMDSTDAD